MATGTISTAVGLDRISRVSGYAIKKGFFNTDTQNLPQVIAIFGEANTANQSGLTTDKVEVTSAAEAATLFGSGSPIHRIVSILRPAGSDGEHRRWRGSAGRYRAGRGGLCRRSRGKGHIGRRPCHASDRPRDFSFAWI